MLIVVEEQKDKLRELYLFTWSYQILLEAVLVFPVRKKAGKSQPFKKRKGLLTITGAR